MKTKTHVRICASSIQIIVEFISCEIRCVTIAYKVYRIIPVTVSFLLRYQNDQGRYIHFLHTRQNVFYATYPYPDKSQPKMKTCDPMIHQANNDISLQENQRRNKYLSTSNPQRQIKKTNGFNEDTPNKNLLFYIWYFQTNLLSNGYFKKQKIHIHF
jgi:hypothetical protein